MKKCLLALLLLAPPVLGDDYCDSLKRYRFAVRQSFNVDTTTTTGIVFRDTTLNDIIRKNVIRYVSATRCIPYTQKFVTSFGVFEYDLDSLILGINDVSIRLNRDDSIKTLLPLPKSQWSQTKVTPSPEAREFAHRPSYYHATKTKIWLYPTPFIDGGGDTVEVDGWRQVPSISAVDSLCLIPQEYRPLILTAICYDVARAQSEPSATLWLMELNAMRAEFGLPPIGGERATTGQ